MSRPPSSGRSSWSTRSRTSPAWPSGCCAMLESLEEITDGFAVDQLVHSLQTATRAEEAGASDEVVVASLCHDIGKAVSVMNHPRIAAEILKPYVERRHVPHDPGPPGLPGQALLRVHGPGPQRPRQVRRASPGTTWPRSSPTSGTRTASTRTTPPSRSRTSSPWFARSSPRRGRFEPRSGRHLGCRRPHRP